MKSSLIAILICLFTVTPTYLQLLLSYPFYNLFSYFQMIGSSLLFVHDDKKASIWLIDFEKSTKMSQNTQILHNVPWVSIFWIKSASWEHRCDMRRSIWKNLKNENFEMLLITGCTPRKQTWFSIFRGEDSLYDLFLRLSLTYFVTAGTIYDLWP